MLKFQKKKKDNIKSNKKIIYREAGIFDKIAEFHVFCTFNNTIITLTDFTGNTIAWTSSGKVGFKGSKKSMPYASQTAAEDIGKKALQLGFKCANIYIKGIGVGRDCSIRGIGNTGVNILTVSDVTEIPHNGCKYKKVKRK